MLSVTRQTGPDCSDCILAPLTADRSIHFCLVIRKWPYSIAVPRQTRLILMCASASQKRVFDRSGITRDGTYLPKSIHPILNHGQPKTDYSTAYDECLMCVSGAVEDLLKKVGRARFMSCLLSQSTQALTGSGPPQGDMPFGDAQRQLVCLIAAFDHFFVHSNVSPDRQL